MSAADERGRILRILDTLALPKDEFVVAGSGSIFLHGLDREKPPSDLDIFCSTRLWFDLLAQRRLSSVTERVWGLFVPDAGDRVARCDPSYLYREIDGLEINVFSQWRQRGIGDIRIQDWIYNWVECYGWPCVRLQFLLDWKMSVGRTKDLEDIMLLRRALGTEEVSA